MMQVSRVLSRVGKSSQCWRAVAVVRPQVISGVVVAQPATAQVREFHVSAAAFAKAKKGGKNAKGDSDEEGGGELPDIGPTKQKMEQVVDRFSQEMSKLKVGRASVDMFNGIQVGSYGSVSSAGQVSVKNATSVNIAVFDPSMVKTVADAIRDCGMGFNPTIENSNVSVFIPKPSKESRELMLKAASKSAEKSKLDIRHQRKLILDEVKKVKGVSADDSKRFTKEVEATTEKNVDKVSQLLIAKEKEVNSA